MAPATPPLAGSLGRKSVTTAIRRAPTMPANEPTAVLLCSDVSERGPGPISASTFAAALRQVAPGARVVVVQDLCSEPSGLPAVLRDVGARRVVVACSQGARRRDEILADLRGAGIHRAGVQVVDMMPGEDADPRHVVEQSIVRMRAALTLLSRSDLAAPIRERMALDSVHVSRRDLFRLGRIARRPVACWVGGRCAGDGACRACVDACPRGALSLAGSRVSVDAAACTGCGACVSTCRSAAMSLAGASIEALEAAASVLVEASRGLPSVRGVAIVCTDAATAVPLGGSWLPLEVPSLEMVTAGWPLQILATGEGATLVGCGEEVCTARGREVARLCADLVDEVAPGRRRRIGRGVVPEPEGLSVDLACASAPAPRPALSVELREPEATVRALSALARASSLRSAPAPASAPTMPAALEPLPGSEHREPWRIESVVSPLGEIAIDAARCSGCGCCALACPTGALAARGPEDSALVLTFDVAACAACGACVASCPEGVVSLLRVVDSSTLALGRHTVAEAGRDGRCKCCGQPLAGGLVPDIIGARLAASHPQLADRLRHEDRCADCLLKV